MIYLDHASTTPIDSSILELMNQTYIQTWANPSSTHRGGQKASALLNQSRRSCAKTIGVDASAIYFTPSATISNQAIIAACTDNGIYESISTKIDHKATIQLKTLTHYQKTMSFVPVDEDGFVVVPQLINTITDQTRIISMIYGHNEIGTIQRIEDISRIIKEVNSNRLLEHKAPIVFHIDAAQIPTYIDLKGIIPYIDALTLSSHKIYGPKGASLLCIKNRSTLTSFIPGGGQEHNLVSGTENIPAIVGLTQALIQAQKHATNPDYIAKMIRMRDDAISQLLTNPSISLNGYWIQGTKERLPNSIHITITNTRQDIFMSYLDLNNIAVSSGSACQSSATEASYVIEAIRPKTNQSRSCNIRLTWGPDTINSDLKSACDTILDGIKKQIGYIQSRQ